MKINSKKIIYGILFAILLGLGFLIIMLTEGSYIAYVPNR